MNRRGFLAALIAAPVAAKIAPAYAPVEFAGGTVSCLVEPAPFVGLALKLNLPPMVVSDVSSHRVTIRTGIPTSTWRRFNRG